jgi:hypothetical protein
MREKWKSKIFMIDMKAVNCWSLLVYVGLKVASKVVKENWEQGIQGWYKCSDIYWRLVQLVMGFIWQAKVMRMRHDMLLHSLKLERLVIWDEYCCQGKQAREKWMRHELMCICCLKLESLHMKLNGEFILVKNISCMTQINVKFKMDG